ncbi:M20 metallopeptidase family protein [Paenibacillus methanolicus]|uniref:Amidohydrolase n=1 Tax=Paenibacillus methanolicus TaxID=582686 RepID=A0A5S5C0G7_9BACL|nr:amidohydrolase [Paenibacillus methanolicus]TYP72679.1 amidohydrolase [Paenibacillus methanolicus]
MSEVNPVEEYLQTVYPRIVAWRRYLHRHPELSFQESRTSAWIAEQLRAIGCEFKEGVGGYGIVAVLRGKRQGPVVALRADIDALPIQDEKTCEYASTVPGIMHACGHDAHTATMLGIASYYASLDGDFEGERRLLFQPAEEVTPGGALDMIRDGALNGVDAIYGVHLWTPFPYGTVATRSGPFMASADEFDIELVGRGGHGGLPHETVDTVFVGSALVQALQSIVSRNVNPLEPAVVTVGSIQAGTTANVIAERCHLKGTVRSFTEEARYGIRKRLEEVVARTAELYGAKSEMDYRMGYPPVVNNEEETRRFFRVAHEQFGEEAVRESSLIMAGEDFAYYVKETKGCFMFVGAGNEEAGATFPHHHPRFNVDERAMLVSARLMIAMAEDFAGSKPA